jgi:hypothetical protein
VPARDPARRARTRLCSARIEGRQAGDLIKGKAAEVLRPGGSIRQRSRLVWGTGGATVANLNRNTGSTGSRLGDRNHGKCYFLDKAAGQGRGAASGPRTRPGGQGP